MRCAKYAPYNEPDQRRQSKKHGNAAVKFNGTYLVAVALDGLWVAHGCDGYRRHNYPRTANHGLFDYRIMGVLKKFLQISNLAMDTQAFWATRARLVFAWCHSDSCQDTCRIRYDVEFYLSCRLDCHRLGFTHNRWHHYADDSDLHCDAQVSSTYKVI